MRESRHVAFLPGWVCLGWVRLVGARLVWVGGWLGFGWIAGLHGFAESWFGWVCVEFGWRCGLEGLISKCPPGEKLFQKLLRTGLATGRLVSALEAASRNVWTTCECVVLNGSDKPVIGVAADVGASGAGALERCNNVRIAGGVHSEASGWRVRCEGAPGESKVAMVLAMIFATAREMRS